MGAEVASASVTLIPTFAGGPGQIEKVMGPHLQRAGATGGQQYGQSFAGALMASPAIRGLAAVGGVGATLFAGLDRLNAIDTAQAKLRGLGNDAQRVDQIMQSALTSVKGTAFGLGDAAGVAAQIVGAGIKPGRELQDVLKTVANTAAAAGTGLDEMGSIFGRVATSNRAYTDNLNQLADRQLNIYGALSEQLGISTDDVRKLASQGQISFRQFADAAAAASGSVAAEMGESFQGRVDNLLAAVGRLGAGLVGGSFAEGKDTLTALTEAIDNLTPAATALGDATGTVVGALNAIPAPVYATAGAFVALRLASQSTAFQALSGNVRGLGTALATTTTIAHSTGSAMGGLRVGLRLSPPPHELLAHR